MIASNACLISNVLGAPTQGGAALTLQRKRSRSSPGRSHSTGLLMNVSILAKNSPFTPVPFLVLVPTAKKHRSCAVSSQSTTQLAQVLRQLRRGARDGRAARRRGPSRTRPAV